MTKQRVPTNWKKWCTTGNKNHGDAKKQAVLKCLQSGTVRGYLSNIPLRPDLENTHSMYPSLEHLSDPRNHKDTVVEARIFNHMKSHLSEAEFWRVVEHLFFTGVQKGKISSPFGKFLPRGWSPCRHYRKTTADAPRGAMAKAEGQNPKVKSESER